MSETDAARPGRVLAAGLSPAWQQVLVVEEFRAGEVNRAREVHWCASGKVLNVGIALAYLAGNEFGVRTLSVIGRRALAAVELELAALGVDCRWVETAAETRICTTIIDQTSGRTTELVENAAPLLADEIARFCDAFSDESASADTVVLTGSLPAGAPATLYRDLLQVAGRKRQAEQAIEASNSPYESAMPRAILDIRGPELLAALDCRPLVVKPNREELARTFDCQFYTDAHVHAAMHRLNERGAQWVVVTHGADAIWATHNGSLYRFEPLRVRRVVNPIGSGDCLGAGIAWATAAGVDMLDAIRLGIAAAADNLEQLLPARLDRRRIEQRAKEVMMTLA